MSVLSVDAPSAMRGTPFEPLVRAWDGEEVVTRYDAASGTWMFVCLHSTRLGPAGGGTRMRVYEQPADGLADAMRLAAAMTRKLALAELPFGGGKAVLAVPSIPRGAERARLLRRYAELVGSLGGRFVTGPDINTTEWDMRLIPYALGRPEEDGGSGTTTVATARGVFHGIRASLRHANGAEGVDGVSVLVQGVGGVGGHLAELLVEQGATVLVADVDEARVREVVARLGVEAVAPDEALATECDVLSPCAIGGVLGEWSIPRLRCRVVAGAANNQLATDADGDRLREAGILFAPDYVINAGGALHGVGLEVLGWTRAELERRLERIGDTLAAIYRHADANGISTAAAAERLVQEQLAA